MQINNQIIGLVLKEFQQILIELAQEFECSPRSAIVRYHDKFEKRGYIIGRIISSWRISLEKIEKMDDLNYGANHFTTQEMFFKEGRFLFSINSEVTRIILQWQVGPRFGRRYLYSIKQTDCGVSIFKEKDLWIS